MGKKFKHTPESAAKAMLAVFGSQVARTWEEYDKQRAHDGNFLNHYEFALLVQEQAHCTFQEAVLALQPVIPELFADYWEQLGLRPAETEQSFSHLLATQTEGLMNTDSSWVARSYSGKNGLSEVSAKLEAIKRRKNPLFRNVTVEPFEVQTGSFPFKYVTRYRVKFEATHESVYGTSNP